MSVSWNNMLLSKITTNKIHSEIIDVQGYFTIAIYINFFIPGSLKIRTRRYTVRLGHLRELIDNPVFDSLSFQNTRRWLPKGEAPYPGYCRAPGSGLCVPALCNCENLIKRWNLKAISQLKKKRGMLKAHLNKTKKVVKTKS